MKSAVSDITPIWPLLAYGAIVVVLIGIIVGLSYVLGQRHHDRATGEAYESGIISTGSARLRFPSQFYLVAMLFVIFDIETVLIISWAIAYEEVGWTGFIGVSVFIFILLAVLIYEWRNGALDFGPDGNKILRAYKKMRKHRTTNANDYTDIKTQQIVM
ncbi:NADH-quinone oxidoreductase subunit A [Chitinophaga nivalis]|uniref:NADH-quinone oxidoreductase subunit A n=1 Tax=Chitinophaga nivalis TaxID=2991709 RepID=A0ABT3IHL2_9BACT|nr:NADH-quinone oxidoreductase subunit A [Chitinophaga nivalis]MCW3466863.1 NADH-quinone oxidoreductase subunit A [Chitinophaga nivalis]MCW3483446.1 NADH-quinone oxidoreductase subunit A [Chitinophaga nivalis]